MTGIDILPQFVYYLNVMKTNTNTTRFETAPCSRCGGSGHYAYNLKDGTRCYGCGGSGRKLTKRGHAAHDYYKSMLMKRISQVKPGDYLKALGTWMRVTAVELVAGDQFAREFVFGDTRYTYHPKEDTFIQVGQSREENERKIALALEYQASLTKAGMPRKRKAL